MTVKELIDKLNELPNKELRVFGEFDPITFIEIGNSDDEEVVFLMVEEDENPED